MKRFQILMTAGMVLILGSAAWAVPLKINVQGVLRDNAGQPVDGSHNLTFRLYTVPSGGTPVYTEAHVGVPVDGGLFQAILGNSSPLDPAVFSSSQLHLGVSVDADAELSPRQEIVSVPYALHALRTGTVDGATGGNITSNVGIGITVPPEAKLHLKVPSVNDPWIILEDNTGAKSTFKPVFQGLILDSDNKIGFSLTNAVVLQIDAGGKVGIGTTSPSAKLEVSTGSPLTKGLVIHDAAGQSAKTLELQKSDGTPFLSASELQFQMDGPIICQALFQRLAPVAPPNLQEWQNSAGVPISVVTPNFDFGIGTTNPQEKVDVAGKVRAQAIKFLDGTEQTTAAGAGNFVSLQSTTPGTPQTGHSNISGTGRIGDKLIVGNDPGPQVLLTPAEALALFQVTRSNGSQLLKLSPTGLAVDGGGMFTSTLPVQPHFIFKGAPGQTGNLWECQNDAGTVVASGGPSGTFSCRGLDASSGSGSGGTVTLTSSPSVGSIDVRGALGQSGALQTWKNNAGGDVALVAFSGGGGGSITLPSGGTISTGSSSGSNGNVTMIAGATSGQVSIKGAAGQTDPLFVAKDNAGGNVLVVASSVSGSAITCGPINTSGAGSGAGGVITLATAQPAMKGIVVDEAASQTANAIETKNNLGTIRFAVGPNDAGTYCFKLKVSDAVGNPAPSDAKLAVINVNPADKALVAREAAGQTANPVEVQNDGGTVRFAVGPNSAGTYCFRLRVKDDAATVSPNEVKVHFRGEGTSSATTPLRVDDGSGGVVFVARDDRRVGVRTATPNVACHVASDVQDVLVLENSSNPADAKKWSSRVQTTGGGIVLCTVDDAATTFTPRLELSRLADLTVRGTGGAGGSISLTTDGGITTGALRTFGAGSLSADGGGADGGGRITLHANADGGNITFAAGVGGMVTTLGNALTNGNSQVAGFVGIGTAPNPDFALDAAGISHATNHVSSSDVRFKKNVRPLTNVLERLDKVRGVSFEWNELYASLGRATPGPQIGVIAQELEKEFPELVTQWGGDYRGVQYDRLSAVLLEAVKEQQKTIENLNGKVEKLEDLVQKLLDKKMAKR